MSNRPPAPVRTRYAPSPTGPQHIGGIRSALFGWLFARHHGGQFILRIEDTDQKRSVPGSLEAILESFEWLGLDIDEGPHIGGDYGPYIQSERLELYQAWAKRLVAQGHAYKCFATAEELAEMRAAGGGYDRRYRDLSAEQAAELEAQGKSYVVRFKMPLSGQTRGVDIIRGEVVFDNAQLQDAICTEIRRLPHLSSGAYRRRLPHEDLACDARGGMAAFLPAAYSHMGGAGLGIAAVRASAGNAQSQRQGQAQQAQTAIRRRWEKRAGIGTRVYQRRILARSSAKFS